MDNIELSFDDYGIAAQCTKCKHPFDYDELAGDSTLSKLIIAVNEHIKEEHSNGS